MSLKGALEPPNLVRKFATRSPATLYPRTGHAERAVSEEVDNPVFCLSAECILVHPLNTSTRSPRRPNLARRTSTAAVHRRPPQTSQLGDPPSPNPPHMGRSSASDGGALPQSDDVLPAISLIALGGVPRSLSVVGG